MEDWRGLAVNLFVFFIEVKIMFLEFEKLLIVIRLLIVDDNSFEKEETIIVNSLKHILQYKLK